MAQFDLYRNPNPESRQWAPYIVDLQHDLLGALNTRVMAPLVIAEPNGAAAIQRLNPKVSIDGKDHILSTAELASVPISALAEPVDNLAAHRDAFLAAVDLLFTAV
ncbi:MAG: CcdB family protein [Wenzhouxiangella sp.]